MGRYISNESYLSSRFLKFPGMDFWRFFLLPLSLDDDDDDDDTLRVKERVLIVRLRESLINQTDIGGLSY